jgi:hypothetical protein
MILIVMYCPYESVLEDDDETEEDETVKEMFSL